jgi:hypothetical protein
MKPWMTALMAVACSGCTTLSLERHTLAQANSTVELRYGETLQNLALIAHDRDALPNFASIFSGTVQVTDTAQLSSTTVWENFVSIKKPTGWFSEAANPQASRIVLHNWALDPIAVPEKLEAMRAACQWILYGPQTIPMKEMSLLLSPDDDRLNTRHFNVAKRLAQLPDGWLHCGRLKDAPAGASYKAHHKGTWVWVMPNGIKGLADFSLVLLDIARIDSNSPTLFNLPPAPSTLKFETADLGVSDYDQVSNRFIRISATVALDANKRLVPDTPYYQQRLDNVGTDSRFRSQINAAGASPGATTPK